MKSRIAQTDRDSGGLQGKTSEFLYLLALFLYLASYFCKRIRWVRGLGFTGASLQELFFVLMLAAGGLAFCLQIWQKVQPHFLGLPAAVLVLAGLSSLDRTQNLTYLAAAVTLILYSYGKNFRRMVGLYLGCAVLTLGIAAAGLAFGFTRERIKIGAYGTGYAWGTVHANSWGFLVLLAALALWYLFLSGRPRLSAGLFLGLGLFLLLVQKCRTAGALLMAFALAQLAAGKIPQREGRLCRILRILLILTPFLCLALTLILAANREWLVRVTYGTYLQNFSKRFVQAGVALRAYGVSLFGTRMELDGSVREVLAGTVEALEYADNAYGCYLIERGALGLSVMLAWLSYVNVCAVRRGDRRLLLLSLFLSVAGLMERVPVLLWYNFTLLYPLAGREKKTEESLRQGEDAG